MNYLMWVEPIYVLYGSLKKEGTKGAKLTKGGFSNYRGLVIVYHWPIIIIIFWLLVLEA